jgi:hypothetical protein
VRAWCYVVLWPQRSFLYSCSWTYRLPNTCNQASQFAFNLFVSSEDCVSFSPSFFLMLLHNFFPPLQDWWTMIPWTSSSPWIPDKTFIVSSHQCKSDDPWSLISLNS